MEISVNGEPQRIDAATSAAQLVEQLGLGGKRLAMEVNGEIVPRSTFAEHTFSPGDRIEIIHAVGGG